MKKSTLRNVNILLIWEAVNSYKIRLYKFLIWKMNTNVIKLNKINHYLHRGAN